MSDIDERLEKLQRGAEMLLKAGAKHDAEIATHNAQIAQLRELVTGVAEGTARLLRIAEMHEQRLDSHDGRLDNLEGG